MRRKPASLLGLVAAGSHVLAFLATVFYIEHSSDPQSPLIWSKWAIADFPISLVYMLGGSGYSNFLHRWDGSWFSQVLYLPHLVHGLLGAIQWYFLPRIFMARSHGGIWGSSGKNRVDNLSQQASARSQ